MSNMRTSPRLNHPKNSFVIIDGQKTAAEKMHNLRAGDEVYLQGAFWLVMGHTGRTLGQTSIRLKDPTKPNGYAVFTADHTWSVRRLLRKGER